MINPYIRFPISITQSTTPYGRGARIRLYRFRLSWLLGRPPWAARKPRAAMWRMRYGIRAIFRPIRAMVMQIDVEWLPIPTMRTRKYTYMCPNCHHVAGRKAFQVPISAACAARRRVHLLTFGGFVPRQPPDPEMVCGGCEHDYHGSGVEYVRTGPDGDEQPCRVPDRCAVKDCKCLGEQQAMDDVP